jgi:hypothetical protein
MVQWRHSIVVIPDSRGQFGIPSEVERQLLEAVTRRLLRIVTEKTSLCKIIICKILNSCVQESNKSSHKCKLEDSIR